MLVWTNMKSKKFFEPINSHIITSTTIYNDHRFTTIYTHHSLFRAESYPNTYCIEYSKYMGILSPGLMTIPLNRNMNHCHRIYIYTYIYIYTWVLMKYNGNIMGIYIYIYTMAFFYCGCSYSHKISPSHDWFSTPIEPPWTRLNSPTEALISLSSKHEDLSSND